jgi:hypothetical protein
MMKVFEEKKEKKSLQNREGGRAEALRASDSLSKGDKSGPFWRKIQLKKRFRKERETEKRTV